MYAVKSVHPAWLGVLLVRCVFFQVFGDCSGTVHAYQEVLNEPMHELATAAQHWHMA